MKKRISTLTLAGVIACCSISLPSCYGPFKLTTKLYKWNTSLGSDVANEIVFLIFAVVVPIYGITLFIDAVILNTIEYWSGSNPVSMNEGDYEQQLVKGKDGVTYRMEATQNQLEITAVDGRNAGETTKMNYLPSEQRWEISKNDVVTSTIDVLGIEDNLATLSMASQGQEQTYKLDINTETAWFVTGEDSDESTLKAAIN